MPKKLADLPTVTKIVFGLETFDHIWVSCRVLHFLLS